MGSFKKDILSGQKAVPLYIEACDSLRKYLSMPEIKKAGKLPPERDLIKALGIGRNTLRRALSILAEEGVIKRIRNRGTILTSEMNPSDPYRKDLSIGMLFPHTGHWKNLLDLVKKEVQSRNYRFRLYLYSWDDLADEKKTFMMARKECVGLFLHPHMQMLDRELIETMTEEHYPIVLFGSIHESIQCNIVGLDNYRAGYQVTRMMIREGCRRIVFINERYGWLSPVSQRITGYKEALEDCGIEFDESRVINPYASDENIEDFILRTNPDGVISSTPDYAFNIMSILLKQGKKIPEDVRIARFGELLDMPTYKDTMIEISAPEKIFSEKLVSIMHECICNPYSSLQRIYINPDIKFNE